MKIHWRDVPYLFKHDYYFRRRIKKLLLLGFFGLIVVSVLLIVAGWFLLTPILSFIFTSLPIVNELLFTYARGFLSTHMLENLLTLLIPLGNNASVVELKEIIVKYFDQLRNNSGIDFQSFQNFISTIRSVVGDGQIIPSELDTVKKLLPK